MIPIFIVARERPGHITGAGVVRHGLMAMAGAGAEDTGTIGTAAGTAGTIGAGEVPGATMAGVGAVTAAGVAAGAGATPGVIVAGVAMALATGMAITMDTMTDIGLATTMVVAEVVESTTVIVAPWEMAALETV